MELASNFMNRTPLIYRITLAESLESIRHVDLRILTANCRLMTGGGGLLTTATAVQQRVQRRNCLVE